MALNTQFHHHSEPLKKSPAAKPEQAEGREASLPRQERFRNELTRQRSLPSESSHVSFLSKCEPELQTDLTDQASTELEQDLVLVVGIRIFDRLRRIERPIRLIHFSGALNTYHYSNFSNKYTQQNIPVGIPSGQGGRKEDEMQCPRCAGMRVPEIMAEGGFRVLALRCIHCGDLVDRVIAHNRMLHGRIKLSRPRTLVYRNDPVTGSRPVPATA